MGCHPSHWLICFKMVMAPPTRFVSQFLWAKIRHSELAAEGTTTVAAKSGQTILEAAKGSHGGFLCHGAILSCYLTTKNRVIYDSLIFPARCFTWSSMIFPWFLQSSHDFPMILFIRTYFHMVFPWFSPGFPTYATEAGGPRARHRHRRRLRRRMRLQHLPRSLGAGPRRRVDEFDHGNGGFYGGFDGIEPGNMGVLRDLT